MPGDHVIFSLTPQCGRCRNCAAGRPNLCEGYQRNTGSMPDGTTRFNKDGVPYYHGLATFAEETVVLEEAVVKIRKDVPLEKACLIGCGVLTGVGAVVDRAKVETGSTVAIYGCGGVGLNVVQGAVLASASKIIAVDRLDFKLQKAEELGATHLVNADKEDPVKRVLDITGGGADYAFEVIGFPQVVRQAFESIRPGGTAVMVGVPPEGGRHLSPRPSPLPGQDPDGDVLRGRSTSRRFPLAAGPVSRGAFEAGRAHNKVSAPRRDQRGLRRHEQGHHGAHDSDLREQLGVARGSKGFADSYCPLYHVPLTGVDSLVPERGA